MCLYWNLSAEYDEFTGSGEFRGNGEERKSF